MQAARRNQLLHILLVEDSPTDALLAREAFADSSPSSIVHQVENGADAVAFLRREGRYAESPRPDLVLLDWNLPRLHGREVLEQVKQDAQLRSIPVVVMSTSMAHGDVKASYDLFANCYVTKPVGYLDFSSVVQSVRDFWFRTAELPREDDET